MPSEFACVSFTDNPCKHEWLAKMGGMACVSFTQYPYGQAVGGRVRSGMRQCYVQSMHVSVRSGMRHALVSRTDSSLVAGHGGPLHVIVVHQNVDPMQSETPYEPCETPGTAPLSSLNYLGLGMVRVPCSSTYLNHMDINVQ
jgi:hypothetical protein